MIHLKIINAIKKTQENVVTRDVVERDQGC